MGASLTKEGLRGILKRRDWIITRVPRCRLGRHEGEIRQFHRQTDQLSGCTMGSDRRHPMPFLNVGHIPDKTSCHLRSSVGDCLCFLAMMLQIRP